MSTDATTARRVLAIHSGAMGDVVLFAHFLSAIRAPGDHVALASAGELARLLAALGAVDEPLDFDTLAMHELFTPAGPAIDGPLAHRLGRRDVLVSCFAAGDKAAQARLAALTGAASSLFLPVRPAQDNTRHLLEVWADLAAGEGISAGAMSPSVPGATGALSAAVRATERMAGGPLETGGGCPSSPNTAAWATSGHGAHRQLSAIPSNLVPSGPSRARLRTTQPWHPEMPVWQVPEDVRRQGRQSAGLSGPGDYAVLHVGAGSSAKCWPLERFEALAEALDVPAVFVLGPAEVERLGERRIADLAARRAVIDTPALAALAGILAEASLFVGNDSGPAHLSAALGAPTVALFGPTDPGQFSPRGRRVVSLRGRTMDSLAVGAVLRACRSLRGRL